MSDLRRAAEVGQVDLDDADQRFALMLQLRVLTSPSRTRRGGAAGR